MRHDVVPVKSHNYDTSHRLRLAAFNARPLATEVNSFPARILPPPNRVSKIRRTAGTNDEPPVRNTISTSLGLTPEPAIRESTQDSICPSSSTIHASNELRSTASSISTTPSANRNGALAFSESAHFRA